MISHFRMHVFFLVLAGEFTLLCIHIHLTYSFRFFFSSFSICKKKKNYIINQSTHCLFFLISFFISFLPDEWEGPEALELISDDENTVVPIPPSTDDEGAGGPTTTATGASGASEETDEKIKPATAFVVPVTIARIESDSEEDGSGDDYVENKDRDKDGVLVKGGKKVCDRCQIFVSSIVLWILTREN
jgi:hypothetical protein